MDNSQNKICCLGYLGCLGILIIFAFSMLFFYSSLHNNHKKVEKESSFLFIFEYRLIRQIL